VAVATARSFGVARVDAARLLVDLRALACASGSARIRLHANDPVVRTAARVQGFTGALRADLVREVTAWDGEIAATWPTLDRREVEAARNASLPASALGKAASYTLSLWQRLARFFWIVRSWS
jgi:hypothetical protein